MNQDTCGCHCWFENMLVFCVAWWLCLLSRKEEAVGNRNGGNTGVMSKTSKTLQGKVIQFSSFWASGIQRLGPFAALIKPLFWKVFLLELNPDHYGVFYSRLFFVCFVIFLGNWAGFDRYSCHVPGLNAKYGQQMTWLNILPQPTHYMYIHNILNLFLISINAYFRLEQLIQWKYVQIICNLSFRQRLHSIWTCLCYIQ